MSRPAETFEASDRFASALAASAAADRQAEQDAWHEFHSLVDRLTAAELLEPGYYVEGWSVRDLVGHIGAWLAEAALLLEQMAAGTYVEGELDVDAANARFIQLMRDVPIETVQLQAWVARWRMVTAWSQLPEPRPVEADRWLTKSGAAHYAEHLPRLRAWTAELLARRANR
jgi:hypothetical protein